MTKCNSPVTIALEMCDKSQANKNGTVEMAMERVGTVAYCSMKTVSGTILGIFYLLWNGGTVEPRIMRMRRVCASARLNCA